ncbi:MAG: hypothetical protein KAU20_08030 [Nanoarchaeota archaeon]|nr:hypothetical protein [Nanoarchaeota archaeon]
MLKPIFLKEGLRMFKRRIKVLFKGIKKYKGNHIQICKQIIEDCWNGRYFMVSNGHFRLFYSRDFGWCCESLIKLGYKERVKKTLEYALDIFSKQKGIFTTINPKGVAFDFPYYASDSVPFIIRSLRLLNDRKLILKHRDFLNKEIKRYFDIVIDKETGLVKKDRVFSSMKDYSLRKSSCYDNCMAGMLALELGKIKILDNPLAKYDYESLIKENFWKKTHFIDDLSGYDFVTGDANVFPFWCGIFNDKKMLESCVEKIQQHGLDKPFPLRYYHSKIKEHDMISLEVFAKGYERDTVWWHMGPLYVDIVSRVNKKKAGEYLLKYKKIIEKYKNFLELFDSKGNPYKSLFYYSDESMLWCVNYLGLAE